MDHFEVIRKFIAEAGQERGEISGQMALQSLELLEKEFAFPSPLFIVKSGAGYFLKFVKTGPMMRDTPQMTSDPVSATRMRGGKADLIVSKMCQLGFDADLVELRMGRYR